MTEHQRAIFELLWTEHWPRCRRQEKKKAMQYWAKVPLHLHATIMSAVDRQKKQPSWQKEDCAFIPYLWRWLRDERWTDEVSLPEDADWKILIEALRAHPVMPSDLPRHIADKFRRMAAKMNSLPWPKVHDLVNGVKAHEEQLERVFYATE